MSLPALTLERPALPECWSAGAASGADAVSCFDSLEGLAPERMIGRWRGTGLPTNHPLDGVLEALGWYGKAFESTDRVHPLLFRTRSGAVIPLDSTFMPVRVALRWPAFARSALVRAVFAASQPILRARRFTARLCVETYRGKRSAVMIYDSQPIADHFRELDNHRVLGMMEMRGMERPYFFMLTRDQTSRA